MDKTKGVWRTVFGRHIFIKDGQNLSDAMKESGKYDDDCVEKIKQTEKAKARDKSKKEMSPAEKIASVHIDFDRDNILPELNESELKKVGAKTSKPVLLKKSIIDRNKEEHGDLTDTDFEHIVANALYEPSEVFSANKEKPYYHFAKVIEINSKGKPEIGLVLLDVNEQKDNFEIVHSLFMRERSFKSLKKRQ